MHTDVNRTRMEKAFSSAKFALLSAGDALTAHTKEIRQASWAGARRSAKSALTMLVTGRP